MTTVGKKASSECFQTSKIHDGQKRERSENSIFKKRSFSFKAVNFHGFFFSFIMRNGDGVMFKLVEVVFSFILLLRRGDS